MNIIEQISKELNLSSKTIEKVLELLEGQSLSGHVLARQEKSISAKFNKNV